MKIGVAQIKLVAGSLLQNTKKHETLIGLAAEEQADLVIFPELSLSGYEPQRAKELSPSPQDARLHVFGELSDRYRITIGIGMPASVGEGTAISLVLFGPGSMRETYAKYYLHPDEEPFFVPGRAPVGWINEGKIALAICYELSVAAHAEKAAAMGAQVYIASVANSASGVEAACERLAQIARTYSMTVLLSNCVGTADGMLCGGRSSIWNSNGALLAQLDDRTEGLLLVDTQTGSVTQKHVDAALKF